MLQGSFAASLARRLPFYYGWVVLGVVCCASIARVGPAVATLSVFIGPMTAEFGWSRTELSGAVSLGGILAAITSPMLGSFLDRKGPRTILLMAVLTTGITILLLSQIRNLAAFYLLFCIARMNFAGPFDLGTLGAVVNWFVARRPLALSMSMLAQMAGLTLMPLIAFWAMEHGGWRAGWVAVGATVLAVGFLPTWLLMVGRPEDLGLKPDAAQPDTGTTPGKVTEPEPTFTRSEALATPTFWLLAIFTILVWPVQTGVSCVRHLRAAAWSGTAPDRRTRGPRPFGLRHGRWNGTHRKRVESQRCAAGCWHLRGLSRRPADLLAGGLGRLLRPQKLRGHSRGGTHDPGDGSGHRPAALGRAAGLDRQLRGFPRDVHVFRWPRHSGRAPHQSAETAAQDQVSAAGRGA
ncbi:MAG: MFS transporter [Hyphomicrobium sp.]|nr:MFS transporter [Hyphomicrobium sp.]